MKHILLVDWNFSLQMAVAYAAFGNGGYYVEPFTVNKIEITDTNEVSTYKPEVRVMSDSTITDVLKWAVDTTNVAGRISGIEIAGKSGTLDGATKKIKTSIMQSMICGL